MSGVRSFKFEDLCRDTPLLIDAIYESGNKGNSSDDPFHPLLGVGNQGGFRKSKMGKTSDYAFIVLFTTGTEIEWPDFLDRQTGIFRYYGDNRTFGRDFMIPRRVATRSFTMSLTALVRAKGGRTYLHSCSLRRQGTGGM